MHCGARGCRRRPRRQEPGLANSDRHGVLSRQAEDLSPESPSNLDFVGFRHYFNPLSANRQIVSESKLYIIQILYITLSSCLSFAAKANCVFTLSYLYVFVYILGCLLLLFSRYGL